ncbi:hypothetical protein [Tomitella fengzijianii]|uniref:hypothetical protein n=1 Tax=Tomitella fengzijianii TaxID=2597660 RepID=UPI00131AAA5D|nr:hypothetical protein [Tomitella fengzijianii]
MRKAQALQRERARSGRRRGRRAALAAGALLAAAGLLAACGGDGGGGASGTTAATATGAAESGGGAAAAGSVSADSLPRFEIDADATTADGAMSYTLPSAEAPAGTVMVTLKNNDTMMPHQAQLLKLHPGVTVQQFTDALATPAGVGAVAPLADFAGGPNAVMPGDESSVVLHLDPGSTYMVICQIPGPGGKPHYALGMIAHFTTAATAQSDGWPKTDATVKMTDFKFSEPSSIDWNKPITVVNDGDQPHELAVLAPADGKTMDDVRAALSAPEGAAQGAPPYETYGGVAAAAPDVQQQTTLELDAGDYLLVCFVVDPVSGKPHYMLGMEQPVTVK